MTYIFNKFQLHILNILIFDSSIEFSDLKKQLKKDNVEHLIERRTFENVKRKKSILGTKTEYYGKKSRLKFSGINSVTFSGEDENFQNNHFIENITLSPDQKELILETTFGLKIMYNITDFFRAELIDYENSDFGKGTSYGSHGYTADEWNEYLRKEKYALQHRI